MPDLMTPAEASAYLWEQHRMRRAPRTLADLRQTGEGPPYHRDGVAVRYSRKLIDQWVRERYGKPVRSTAEESAARQVKPC